jgi:hypothetical protein
MWTARYRAVGSFQQGGSRIFARLLQESWMVKDGARQAQVRV